MNLVKVNCKRCKKPIMTLSKSLHGVKDSEKARFDRLCNDCITDEEREQILIIQYKAIKENWLRVGGKENV
jgi:hypothetical protein